MPVLSKSELERILLDQDPARLTALERQATSHFQDQIRNYQPVPAEAADNPRIDPLPLVLDLDEFESLGRMVAQIGSALEAFLADVMGPQRLLAAGVIPPDLLWDGAGWEPSWHGLARPGQSLLTFFGIDLIPAEAGWIPTGLQGAFPEGLGRALLQRIALFRAIGALVNSDNVLRLAPFLKEAKDQTIGRFLSDSEAPRVAVWHEELHGDVFEPLFLARYLGYPTVIDRDLTVRSGSVHLKTLQGLRRLDVIWRWVEDLDLDPLGRVPTGFRGVSGLFDVVRQDRLVLLNGPGSGLIERLLPSNLLTPVIRWLLEEEPLFPTRTEGPFPKTALFREGSVWRQAPYTVRLFGVRFRDGWRLLPGGLVHAVLPSSPMPPQKDLWVLAPRPTAQVSLLSGPQRSEELSRLPDFPSRLAEDLYWMGRYTERAWQACSLARKRVEILEDEAGLDEGTPEFLGLVLSRLAELRGEVYTEAALTEHLRHALGLLLDISRQVTDRLSSGMHRLLGELWRLSRAQGNGPSEEHVMNAIDLHLAALNGYITENMTRTPGWYFLDMGRRLERLSLSLDVMAAHFAQEDALRRLGLLLDLFDSSITYRTRYRNLPEMAPVLDLLVADESNPRSLAFQAGLLQDHGRSLPSVGRLGRLQPLETLFLRLSTALRTFDPTVHDRDSFLHEMRSWSELVNACADEVVARYFTQVKSATTIQSRTGGQAGP